MAVLNNNQVATLVNSAIAQATGSSNIATMALEEIVDRGNDASVIGSVEQFTKALLNVMIGNWYTDRSYRSQYDDPFFQNSEAFAAIASFITIQAPDVTASHAWTDFVSGTTTAGVYTLYLPTVDQRVYGKSISWELPVAITDEQWNTAFHSAAELAAFVNQIFLVVDNALVMHMEDLDRANRNNFMALKIEAQNAVGNTGIHVVDLVDGWANFSGATADITVEDFLNDRKALNWAKSELIFYKDFLKKMSVKFNTAGFKRFTPDEDLVVQVLARFEQYLNAVAESDTYHNEILQLPGHQTVPYWQAEGDLSFDATSEIKIETVPAAGADPAVVVNQDGIVAFFAHKWAIMHTIVNKRTAVTRFDPEAVTQYYNQNTDRYMNNLTMPAIVFVLKDWTAPVDDGGGE